MIALRNVNKHFWRRCRGTVAVLPSNLVRPRIFSKQKKYVLFFFTSSFTPATKFTLISFFFSLSLPLPRYPFLFLSLYTPFDPLGWVFRAILSGTQFLIWLRDSSLIELVQENSFLSLKLRASLSSSTRGGERFEQLRTSISRIRAFISSVPKIMLKGTSPEQLESGGTSVSCKSYHPQIRLWCIFLNFPRDHVSRKVEEGVVGRKWVIFYDSSISTTTPWKRYHMKPIIFPCQGNLRGVSPRNMPWPWPPCYKSTGLTFLVKGS